MEKGIVKTAVKKLTYQKDELKEVVLSTVKIASDIVGSTLGPNGKTTLIERNDGKIYTTKDGITVFNSISFADSTRQAILEAVREASAKTNDEAGDGTTTATVLAEALVRYGFNAISKDPTISQQKLLRELERINTQIIQPFIKNRAVKITNDNQDELLRKVSMIATNSDAEMTDAVVGAFDLVGTNGNITISEEFTSYGSGYSIDKMSGFPIMRGYEDSCMRFFDEFINDKAAYKTFLDKPRFILYNGQIKDLATILPALNKVVQDSMPENGKEGTKSPNVVVVAHGFSENIIAWFAQNFKNPDAINILPLKTQVTANPNSPYHFLLDLAAYTGAEVFDPLTRPFSMIETNPDLLSEEPFGDSMDVFEFGRFRSLITGSPNEQSILDRVDQLTIQAKNNESIADKEWTNERISILTGGIAKIKVLGTSESETREKKDRVEDAVMAIKGALKNGILPGGARTLNWLSNELVAEDNKYSKLAVSILRDAFREPLRRLLSNCGFNEDQSNDLIAKYDESNKFEITYDAMNHEFGDFIAIGVVDSGLAVSMSVSNSLGIAKMLMGLGSVIVYKRDHELDRESALKSKSQADYIKHVEDKDGHDSLLGDE